MPPRPSLRMAGTHKNFNEKDLSMTPLSRSFAFIVAFLLLGLSFIGVAKIGSETIISVKNKGDVVVKGFAKKQIKSDLGVFQATIKSENPELKAAYQELSSYEEKVKAFLKDAAFEEGEIKFLPAQIEEKNKLSTRGHALNEVEKYVLSQDFKVESADVEKVEQLSVKVGDLLNDGIKVVISQPQYYYTKLDDLKVEMVGNATENARSRAQVIASKGKFHLGPIGSVRVGVFQITPVNSTDVSDYGINDTSSIHKEIKSVVEIRYFVK